MVSGEDLYIASQQCPIMLLVSGEITIYIDGQWRSTYLHWWLGKRAWGVSLLHWQSRVEVYLYIGD